MKPFAIALLMLFCSGSAYTQEGHYPRGVIIDSVPCAIAASYTYALYLPSAYSPDTTWPLLLLFDPSARGHLAVEVFRKGAEKYGYILACSNTCKNGPMQANLQAAQIMENDVMKKFSVDNKRIYTGGFSGGSRLAGALALLYGPVAGIIACGAGLPQVPNNVLMADTGIVYVATTGFTDMNFLELREVEKTLDALGIPTRIFDFDGTHDWPPPALASTCMSWLDLHAMKKGLKPMHHTFADSLLQAETDSVRQFIRTGDFYRATTVLHYIQHDFAGICNIAQASALLDSLENDKQAEKACEETRDAMEKETQQRDAYGMAINYAAYPEYAKHFDDVKTDDYWTAVGNDLSKAKRSGNTGKARSANRLWDFIGIGCYETGRNFMQSGEYSRAQSVYHIWSLVDPDNKNPWIGLAEAYAQIDSSDAGTDALRRAVKNGMTLQEIRDNTYLNPLHASKEYQKITGELEEKSQ